MEVHVTFTTGARAGGVSWLACLSGHCVLLAGLERFAFFFFVLVLSTLLAWLLPSPPVT